MPNNNRRDLSVNNRNNQVTNAGLSNQAPAFQPPVSNMVPIHEFHAYTNANESILKNLQTNVINMQQRFDCFQRDQSNFQRSFDESQRKNETFQNMIMSFV